MRKKMKDVMMLVKRHGQKMEYWVGDQPQSWDHTSTRKMWESINDEFKASYYTIQRSGLRKIAGQGRQKLSRRQRKTEIKVLVGPQSTEIAQQLVYLRKLDV